MVMGGVVFPAQKVLNADALRHTQQRRKFSCVYSRLRGNDTMGFRPSSVYGAAVCVQKPCSLHANFNAS
jgi:hypothetical protein